MPSALKIVAFLLSKVLGGFVLLVLLIVYTAVIMPAKEVSQQGGLLKN